MKKSITEAKYITLQEACKRFPSKPHINTVKRWTTKGYDGFILKSCRHGRRRMTSIEWIDEFLAKMNGADVPSSQPTVSHQVAERDLDALGIR